MKMSFETACKIAQTLANADKENYIISKTDDNFEIQKENGFTKTVYLQVLPEY
jgi:hypothetical protein